MMNRVRQAMAGFFLLPASFKPLVFLRISFALFSICLCINLWRYNYALYGNEGYMQWVISDHLFKKPFIPDLHSLYNWINSLISISDAVLIKYVFSVYLVCLALIAVGLFSNAGAVIAWFLHLLYLNTGNIYGYGVETFTHVLLFYFIFLPVDADISLTRWMRKCKYQRPAFLADKRIKARIGLRLLQLHLCIVYANAGIAKLFGHQWYNGEAVWRSVANFKFNPFNLGWLSAYPWLLVAAGLLVLLLETLYPVLVWSHRLRRWFIAAIILMHVAIAAFMGLYFFSAIMIIMNMAAFGLNAHCPAPNPTHNHA